MQGRPQPLGAGPLSGRQHRAGAASSGRGRRATQPVAAATVVGPDAGAAAPLVPVTGTVGCADHPVGCPARITVVDARGQRVARARAEAGRYRLGPRPGHHTLVVSAPGHSPRAESVTVGTSQPQVRLDIRLQAPDTGTPATGVPRRSGRRAMTRPAGRPHVCGLAASPGFPAGITGPSPFGNARTTWSTEPRVAVLAGSAEAGSMP